MALAAAALFVLVQAGGPAVTESVAYYDVSGATAAELRKSLNRNRPGGETTRFGDAHANWHVSWHYRYRKQEQCAITSVSTTLEIRITLPRWSPTAEAPPELVAAWDRYLAALRLHEKGHGDIGRDAARTIDEKLRQLGPFPDCPQLEAAIKKTGDEVIADHQRQELGYDLRTVHGVSQGATFP